MIAPQKKARKKCREIEKRLIDLREVKQKAAGIFPAGHPIHELLAGEPDFLPFEIGCEKLYFYAILALSERKRTV